MRVVSNIPQIEEKNLRVGFDLTADKEYPVEQIYMQGTERMLILVNDIQKLVSIKADRFLVVKKGVKVEKDIPVDESAEPGGSPSAKKKPVRPGDKNK